MIFSQKLFMYVSFIFNKEISSHWYFFGNKTEFIKFLRLKMPSQKFYENFGQWYHLHQLHDLRVILIYVISCNSVCAAIEEWPLLDIFHALKCLWNVLKAQNAHIFPFDTPLSWTLYHSLILFYYNISYYKL